MNEQQQRDNGVPSFLSASSVNRWLNVIFDAIARMVTGHGNEGRGAESAARDEGLGQAEGVGNSSVGRSSVGRSSVGPSGFATRRATPRRSIVGYINSGLYKMEQARRTAAIIKQYTNALQTIRLTRRAIRRTPRSSRHLFRGYNHVLGDARLRVKMLYKQLRHTEAHLRTYDPHALSEEIRRLERMMDMAPSPTARAESELILEARRDLLESVLQLDDKLTTLLSQLGTITAALELNHVRVVAISSRAGYGVQADLLQTRMQEVTEQLTLLEESLRELDAG